MGLLEREPFLPSVDPWVAPCLYGLLQPWSCRQCKGWGIRNGQMNRVTAAVLLASSLAATGVRAEEPDGNYTFATKEEALQRASEMGCEGAYEWFGVWSPCEEDGGEDDHSGHDHSGHSH